MPERQEEANRLAAQARQAHDLWLEQVRAELDAAGVPRDEISVHFNSGLRTVVMVRGERRYEFTPPAS